MDRAQRLVILDIAETAACWRSVFFGADIFSKRALLQKQPSLAFRKFMYGGKKWYPLLLAAHRGDVSFVESLLDAGAEINYVDESGNTALRMAIEAGHPEPLHVENQDTARVLLSRGADIRRGNPSAAAYAERNSHRDNVIEHIAGLSIFDEVFGSDDEAGGNPATGADMDTR